MKTRLLLLLALTFGLTVQAQQYKFKLVQNSLYDYSVYALPDFTSTSPHPFVNDQNFTILLPEGSDVANVTNGYIHDINTSTLLDPYAPGQDAVIFNKVSDVQIPSTQNVDILLTNFTITNSPTSGEINLIPNSHPLVVASPPTFQSSFLGTLSGFLGDPQTENYNGQEGTTTYSFSTLGTAESELTGYSVHPNPATDVVTINGLENELSKVEVYNITGQRVLTSTTNMQTINVSAFNAGVYFVKLSTEVASTTIKLVKE